jgi:dTDP-4-amino-4,6-dideoxygalactose transaminase
MSERDQETARAVLDSVVVDVERAQAILHAIKGRDEREQLRFQEEMMRVLREAVLLTRGITVLERHPGVELLTDPHGACAGAVLLDLEQLSIDRYAFMEALRLEQIGTGVHFEALHLQPYYRERFGWRPGQLPHAERIAARTVSLPLSPRLTDDDVDDVVAAVARVLHQARR